MRFYLFIFFRDEGNWAAFHPSETPALSPGAQGSGGRFPHAVKGLLRERGVAEGKIFEGKSC